MSYYRDADFQQWLVNQGDKQASQTKGYIDSLFDNVLKPYGMEFIITSLSKAILNTKDALTKLERLEAILRKTAYLKNNNPNASILHNCKCAATSLIAWCTGLNKYTQYLREETQPTNKYVNWGAQKWNTALNRFWDDVVSAVAIDGFSSLLKSPAFCDNEDVFVKCVIENSYFINATAVKNHHMNIMKGIADHVPVYARKSTSSEIQYIQNGQLVFDDNGKVIPIIKDADGNKAVRDLIEDNTGYTVSSGDANFFTNYKISHVWGNAIDPRYFTSLWNIALIPAWANDLMDKTNSNKTLALKMINTVKAICEKLFPCNDYWNALSINPIAANYSYVVRGTYRINILRNKTDNSPIGTIISQTVIL